MPDCSLLEKTLPEEALSVVHTNTPDRPNWYLNRRWLLELGAAGLLLAVGIPLGQSRLVAQEADSAPIRHRHPPSSQLYSHSHLG